MPTSGSNHPAAPRPALVVALVGQVDLRAVRAVEVAVALGSPQVRALHVVESTDDLHELARRWMELERCAVPLDTVDRVTSVPAAVADAVGAYDVEDGTGITVVMGRLQPGGPGWRLLHDRSSVAIARALDGIDGVAVRWVDVPIHA